MACSLFNGYPSLNCLHEPVIGLNVMHGGNTMHRPLEAERRSRLVNLFSSLLQPRVKTSKTAIRLNAHER